MAKALLGVLCIVLLSVSGAAADGFRLKTPTPPLLPGDLLSFHGTARFDSEAGLEVRIGSVRAELFSVRPNHVQAVVPFGLGAGERPVELRTGGVVRFATKVQLAEIQASALGASDFKWGLTFADPVRFSVGSAVSGWLLTQKVSAVPGTLAPVSVTGKITGKTDNVVSLGLVSDTSGVVARLTLASLDLATGQFFGRSDSPLETIRIVGTATLTVKPPVVSPRPRPIITSVTPNPAPPGSNITIVGSGFGAVQGTSTLALAGKPVTDFPKVLKWSDTQIVANIGQFMLGEVTVEVVVGGLPPIPPVVIVIPPPCPPALAEFVRVFGGAAEDVARSVQQTRDCGYVLAGRTASFGAGGFDMLLIKTDGNGVLQFQRTYGGPGFEEAFGIQQTFDNGYILVGAAREVGSTTTRVLLVKTDVNGNTTWMRGYGAAGTHVGLAVQQTRDGGYIVTGNTGPVGRPADVLLMKVDGDGELLWERTFGGDDFDIGRSVRQTADGGYIVAGSTRSFGAGLDDVYVVKTNADGVEEWSRAIGGTLIDEGHSVKQTANGQYVVGGRTISPQFNATTMQVLAVRIDARGQRFSTDVYGGTGLDEGFAVTPTSDGGFVLAGRTNSPEFAPTAFDSLLIKTDCRLEQTNRRNNFGQGNVNDMLFAVGETTGGSYIMAGSSAPPGLPSNALLIKASRFPRTLPVVETFTANGSEFLEISVGNVELFWHVRNATSIRVRRISGPGPNLDETFVGAADVQNERTVTFTLDACSGPDGCSDTVYRVTATSNGGCDVVEANVTVRQVVSENVRRLVEIETSLVQRFQFANFPPPLFAAEGQIVPSHPNVLGLVAGIDPSNTCIEDQGKPFLRLPQALALGDIDDREPGILLYGSFNGQANRLVGWGYGRPFLPFTDPPGGLPVDDSEWFIHWGGWHTGDGAMTRWNILELPPIPPFDIPGTPLNEGLAFLAYCFTLPNGCGPPPYTPHPSLWDIHMFRDPNAGPPRVGILASSTNVLLPDPCNGTGLSGLGGDPFVDLNGSCLFCYPGETTEPP